MLDLWKKLSEEERGQLISAHILGEALGVALAVVVGVLYLIAWLVG